MGEVTPKPGVGGPWEAVPADTFEGQVYFRQRLPDPEITPENFTVLVGDRWVATMQTKEYMEIAFYAGYREALPPPFRSVFPYRLVWSLLMGETENYIGGLEHEAFHALQGHVVPDRLAEVKMPTKVRVCTPGMIPPWERPGSKRWIFW